VVVSSRRVENNTGGTGDAMNAVGSGIVNPGRRRSNNYPPLDESELLTPMDIR